MATLIEAALRVTQKLHDVRFGTATGGSVSTLVDSLCTEQQGFYNNGLMWLITGSNPGEWVEILSYGSGTFTFKSAVTPTIAAGDKYAVIPDDLSRSQLRNAINEACKSVCKIYKSDATLVVVDNQEEYTLPSGVSDVRRIEIAENATSPYSYAVNAYWKEAGGVIYFHPDHIPDAAAGNKIRVWYATVHPDLDDTTSLYWQVDDILWLAVIYILQHDYIAHGEDHKWVVEMNRKAEEEQEKANRKIQRPPSKTPYMIGPFG